MDTGNINIRNVWQDETVHNDVIKFWDQLQVIPPNIDSKERAKQLVFTASKNGNIIGVTTAYPVKIKQLNNNYFFNFRTLIHPDYRVPGLVDKLAVETIDFLESLSIKNKGPCIGMITLVENEQMKQKRREAVYPSTGFTFIGFSKKGAQIRVRYFKGAKI